VRACDVSQIKGRPRKSIRGRHESEDHEIMRPSEPNHPVLRTPATVRNCAPGSVRASYLRACGTIVTFLAAATAVQAAPGFYGTTGLFSTPTAAVAPRGAWSAGANYVGRDFRRGASSISDGTVAHSLTVTLLPRVEVAAVLNNYEGKLGARRLDQGLSPDRDLGGYTVDRMVAVHWLASEQRGSRPAIAFGVRDLFGTMKLLKAQYGVASLRRGNLTVSAGVGTRILRGPFGGVEYSFGPRVTAIVEGLTGQVNGGLRIEPFKNVQLDTAFMGFRSLGGGLSYRRRF
jgi:hypothetical protein